MKLFLVLLLFLPNFAYAENTDVIGNVSLLGNLLIMIGYSTGLIYFVSGLYGLYAQATQGNDPSRSVSSSLWKMFAGICLLSSSFFYSLVRNSIGPTWTMTKDNLALSQTALNQGTNPGFLDYLPDETIKLLFTVIWLIGLSGFLKGLGLIRMAGDAENGAQDYNSRRKILTHILGGAMLMNIRDVSSLVYSFFGWNW